MPLFMIERSFAEQLDMNHDTASSVRLVNDEVGVKWLVSFLSADKKKTYCLYEAPSQLDASGMRTRSGRAAASPVRRPRTPSSSSMRATSLTKSGFPSVCASTARTIPSGAGTPARLAMKRSTSSGARPRNGSLR
ncbi:MAG: hypothetical protein QOF51_338 [Chloroflexota bacterium]|nr:hypothetical protein [Chloroflexota bacterium]